MSLEIKKRGDTWTYVVDVGRNPKTGKRQRKSQGGFKSKGDCRAAAAKIIAEVEKGEYNKETELTVSEYFEKWLKEYAIKNTAATTYKRYEGIVKKVITPSLGKLKLTKLTPLHVQEFYSHYIDDVGNSTTTVRQYHAVLSKGLNMALKWGLINRNICLNVEKPKKAHTEMHVLDEKQLNLFLDKIKNMTIYLPSVIAAHTGMRLGEICGLTWDDIDMDNKVLYVTKQLQEVNTTLQLVGLKTKASKRKITLSVATIDILKELKEKQAENKKYFNEAYNKQDFILCKNNGDPYDPQYISRNFKRVLAQYKHKYKNENTGEIEEKSLYELLNIPLIRFHDLRHTHATILLKAGVNPKVVAERLGHSTVSMTLDTYSHVLPDLQKEVANKLDDIFL